MRTVEFQSTILNSSLLISGKIRTELKREQNKNVRVMVFVDDNDDKAYKKMVANMLTQTLCMIYKNKINL